MKHKRLKNYFKFGILLFGISFLCYTCQKDDEFTTSSNTEIEQANLPQGNNQSGISLRTIDFNNAQHKNRLVEKLTELAPQEQNPYTMLAFSENQDHILLQGLNVSQDSVVFASFGNKHSYTFAT